MCVMIVIFVNVKTLGIGGTCSTYGERCVPGFGGDGLRERDSLDNLGVDRRIVLKWILNRFGSWSGLIRFRIGTCGGIL